MNGAWSTPGNKTYQIKHPWWRLIRRWKLKRAMRHLTPGERIKLNNGTLFTDNFTISTWYNVRPSTNKDTPKEKES